MREERFSLPINAHPLPLLHIGEMAELKADLQSDKKDRKKEAIKKIIANMTVGKDVRWVIWWSCDICVDHVTYMGHVTLTSQRHLVTSSQ